MPPSGHSAGHVIAEIEQPLKIAPIRQSCLFCAKSPEGVSRAIIQIPSRERASELEGVSSPRDPPPPPPPPTERTVRHSVSWQVDVLIMVKSNCLFNHGTLPCFLEVFSLGKVSHPSWDETYCIGMLARLLLSQAVRLAATVSSSSERASFSCSPTPSPPPPPPLCLPTSRRSGEGGISFPWRNANSANSLRKFHDGVYFPKDKLSLH